MLYYIVRIQLVDSAPEDYPPLWEALEAEGFDRTIQARGTHYRLPNGTYRCTTDDPLPQVHQRVVRALKKAQRRARVFVAQTVKGCFANLERDDDAWLNEVLDEDPLSD